MKHRYSLLLLLVVLPICILLRTIQIAFTIDGTTGFIKQQYSAISVMITVIICAAAASVGLLAVTIGQTKPNSKKQLPVVSVASALASGMFIYQAVSGTALVVSAAWYDVLLLILTLASAFVFLAYGLKNIYNYNMPSILLAIPVVYYIVKLISVFITTAKLALVTENIFLIFTNSVLLWFMLEFASFENKIGDIEQKPNKLFSSGLVAVVLCGVTSLPKLILSLSGQKSLSSGDIAEVLLSLSMGIFILAYIVCKFADKDSHKKTVGKHSA